MNAISKVYKDLAGRAETIRNTDPVDLSTMEVGDEHRQGDLRVIRLADDFVKCRGNELVPMRTVPRQLAPGTTQGSRHEISKTKGLKAFSLRDATPLDGPVIMASQSFSITHPEHGDCVNLPPGCYAFPGQRALAEDEREAKRAAD